MGCTLQCHHASTSRANARITQTLTDLPVFDDSPFEALDIDADSKQGRKQDDGFQAESLAFIVLGFSSPVQERDDVLGHL